MSTAELFQGSGSSEGVDPDGYGDGNPENTGHKNCRPEKYVKLWPKH
jgi:hypothetical protein